MSLKKKKKNDPELNEKRLRKHERENWLPMAIALLDIGCTFYHARGEGKGIFTKSDVLNGNMIPKNGGIRFKGTTTKVNGVLIVEGDSSGTVALKRKLDGMSEYREDTPGH